MTPQKPLAWIVELCSPGSLWGNAVLSRRMRYLRAGMLPLTLRLIEPADDPEIAAIIRTVMPEFGAVGDGFAIQDPEVDFMSRAYSGPRSAYFVVEQAGRIVGGGGVGPLAGAEETLCELRKMYFLSEVRGTGMGETLLKRCIEEARKMGYQRMYLETLSGMKAAQRLYRRMSFERMAAPLGATGHHGCDQYYVLNL